MRYRVFQARLYDDAKNTKPVTMPRRKTTVRVVNTEDEARRICREHNYDRRGRRIVRPYGIAFEYEGIGS